MIYEEQRYGTTLRFFLYKYHVKAFVDEKVNCLYNNALATAQNIVRISV